MPNATPEDVAKVSGYFERCPHNKGILRKCAAAVRLPYPVVREAMEILGVEIVKPSRTSPSKKAFSMSKPCPANEHVTHPGIDGFKTLFDNDVIVPSRIESGIAAHLVTADGRPSYMADDLFREKCGVRVAVWRRYAKQYIHLQVKVPGGALYWGHPDIVEQMRESVAK